MNALHRRQIGGQWKLVRTSSNRLHRCGTCLPWYSGAAPYWPSSLFLAFSLASPRPTDCCLQNGGVSTLVQFSAPSTINELGVTLPALSRSQGFAQYHYQDSFTCGGQTITLRADVQVATGAGFSPAAAQLAVIIDIGIPLTGFTDAACSVPSGTEACQVISFVAGATLQPANPWNLCATPQVLVADFRTVTLNSPDGIHSCSRTYNASYSIEPV